MSKPSSMEQMISSLQGNSQEKSDLQSKPQTRAQQDLKLAAGRVQEIKDSYHRYEKDFASNYLSRVKSFPALVMTSGLAQALAFSAEKKAKDNALGQAHDRLLKDVAAILNKTDVIEAVQNADRNEYMHMTRRVLSAWVYYRRFASSVLVSLIKESKNEK